jgi:hypothetical protein
MGYRYGGDVEHIASAIAEHGAEGVQHDDIRRNGAFNELTFHVAQGVGRTREEALEQLGHGERALRMLHATATAGRKILDDSYEQLGVDAPERPEPKDSPAARELDRLRESVRRLEGQIQESARRHEDLAAHATAARAEADALRYELEELKTRPAQPSGPPAEQTAEQTAEQQAEPPAESPAEQPARKGGRKAAP